MNQRHEPTLKPDGAEQHYRSSVYRLELYRKGSHWLRNLHCLWKNIALNHTLILLIAPVSSISMCRGSINTLKRFSSQQLCISLGQIPTNTATSCAHGNPSSAWAATKLDANTSRCHPLIFKYFPSGKPVTTQPSHRTILTSISLLRALLKILPQ